MGLLVDGVWHDDWYDTSATGGRFVRKEAQFRHVIGEGGEFSPQAGRYHLYVSLACPWAHRTLIFRKLKGLEALIDVSVVHPHMLEHGWSFQFGAEPLYGFDHAHQLYTKSEANYSGRVTVPILWDKESSRIVNNESSDIIRIFNSAFDDLTGNDLDFYPEPLRVQIDALNELVYANINNGVYRCGFATTQEAYDEAYDNLFAVLDELETCLDKQRYLVGEVVTEADWRLFTTLIRFDAVYFSHFKCNQRRIYDYPNLFAYMCDLYQTEGVAETVDLWHIKQHYYYSHESINPTRIVPKGPAQDWHIEHNRARRFA